MVKRPASLILSLLSMIVATVTMRISNMLSMVPSFTFSFSLLVTLMAVPADAFAAAQESKKLAQPTSDLFQRYMKAGQVLPAAYSHCLTHHHLATECVTAGCMAGLGDFLAQRQSKPPWDAKRSMNFVLKGLGEGIMWSIWYQRADHWVALLTDSALSSGMLTPIMVAVFKTIVSLVLDLFLACPLIYGLWDIPFPALLSGVPLREIPRQVKSKLGEMMIASLKLWTPVNVLIYNSPLEYRVLLMSTADVFWQSIVSAITTRELSSASAENAHGGENGVENGVERSAPLVPTKPLPAS